MTQTLAFIGAIIICFIGGYLWGKASVWGGAVRAILIIYSDLQLEQGRNAELADDNIALRAERDALMKQVKMPIKKVEVE